MEHEFNRKRKVDDDDNDEISNRDFSIKFIKIKEKENSLLINENKPFEFERNKIYNMDCLEGMKYIPNECVDVIITDPPFSIDLDKKKTQYNRKVDKVLEGYCEISDEDYRVFTQRWISQAYRILKTTGSMFVFSGWNKLKDVLLALDEVGFITINHLIWKFQFGVYTKRKFVTSHIHVLFVCKNEKKRKFYPSSRFESFAKDESNHSLRYRDMEDVWDIKREYWRDELKTPTKLPSEIVRKCLAYTSQLGDFILDPFLGSGQVAVLAKEMGRQFGGFEICKLYFEFAQQRL